MKTYNRLNNVLLRDSFKRELFKKEQLIFPLFIVEGSGIYEEIESMDNQFHYSVDKLDLILDELIECKIFKVLLFGIPSKKSNEPTELLDYSSFLNDAIKYIKSFDNRFYVITDVCLCEYSEHGHCQLFDSNNKVDIDITRQVLSEIALNHVKAGADMVAPSDMQDSRIKYIREKLDANKYRDIPIMSYSVKFASNYYGPFREAANSKPMFGDRNSYQVDYFSTLDYKSRVTDDLNMGADIIMVKPALAYLDVISDLKNNFNSVIAAFQVSGEYVMNRKLKGDKFLDYEQILIEQLNSFKRAGVDLLVTYHALEISRIIDERN